MFEYQFHSIPFKTNQLKLNPHKTKMVYFSKSLTHPDKTDDITLDGVKLQYEEDAPFLGIQIIAAQRQ